ncbi:MAG: serine protease [Candidatus Kerfeldbacteria bacterium]|nr:serine protease [Candidatus Kerfeldbacteria bacterium]
MVVHPAPTAPKQRLQEESDALKRVWPAATLVQPPRIPWGTLIFLIIGLATLMASGVIVGFSLLVQRYPQSWLATWWPTVPTTTVVRSVRGPAEDLPAPVENFADSLFGLAIDQGPNGRYTDDHVLTAAIPLSSNGWLLALTPAVPSATAVVALPNSGQPLAVSSPVTDSAGPFSYLKTTDLTAELAVILESSSAVENQPVWIVRPRVHRAEIVRRTVLGIGGSPWQSSDRLERWLKLDQPLPEAVGAAVVDRQGRLVGLLGDEQRVWPTAIVQAILKPLLQQGTFERPALGLTTINQQQTVLAGGNATSGLLISSSSNSPAIHPDGPASRAGLEVEDSITAIDGQAVPADLLTFLQRYQPGESLALTFVRQGVKKEVTLELATVRR